MDQPQRANAAQLASRNIKSAKKPSGRLNKQPLRPGSSSGQSDEIRWAPMPSENPGVLFGGTLQSTGTFDFQSPAGTISLPSPTRGKSATKHDVLNGPSDTMEGRFAGDDRGGKRQFGTSSGQANSPFKMSYEQNTSANIFGSTNAQQTPGGITESAAAQQANSPFKISFGQNTPANIFGSTNAQQTPGGNPFSFTPQSQRPRRTTRLVPHSALAEIRHNLQQRLLPLILDLDQLMISQGTTYQVSRC
jgi:hypothetical protein